MTKDKFCDDCYYCVNFRSGGMRCCNYLIMTNQRRPCPPGEGCTVKVPRKVYRRRKKNAED